MECDDLIEELFGEDNNVGEDDPKKQRLSSIISGGKSVQYLGKEISIAQLDDMPPEQVSKITITRYEN